MDVLEIDARDQHAASTRSARSSSSRSASRRCAIATRSSSSTKSTGCRSSAFDALLKSIEEPPPHVKFMMATTEMEEVPATIQSRSQVFELKTIGVKQIARSAAARSPRPSRSQIDEAALMLVARSAEGSMRDALSALRPGASRSPATRSPPTTSAPCSGWSAATCCSRSPDAIAREDAPASSSSPAAPSSPATICASSCRELARLMRDLLRAQHRSLARLAIRRSPPKASASRCSTLAAPVLARGPDARVRRADQGRSARSAASMQPRYHLEMALLRWIHLRKLVPLTRSDRSAEGRTRQARPCAGQAAWRGSPAGPRAPRRGGRAAPVVQRPQPPAHAAARPTASGRRRRSRQRRRKPDRAGEAGRRPRPVDPRPSQGRVPRRDPQGEEVLLRQVVAQAQQIDVEGDRSSSSSARSIARCASQLEQQRAWLEPPRAQLAGRKMAVVAAEGTAGRTGRQERPPSPTASPAQRTRRQALKQQRAGRFGRPGDARRLRRRDQGCRRDVGKGSAPTTES